MNLDLLPTAAAQPENRDIPTQQEALRRTVIFLDIDGVLQPPSSQRRFKHDLEELRRSLADRLADEIYLGMDKYDLGAVCFDWDREAVERLRSLCKDFGAGIVISSDWRRSKSTRGLQALFRVYELHHYVTSEASLSFLGFGLPTTVPSGGGMLSREGREYMEIAPRLAVWPGLCLTVVVYCLNMVGDAVRDLLDPRLRGGSGRLGAYGAQAVGSSEVRLRRPERNTCS